MDFDLIVIGAGTAGVRAARTAAARGARTALVEDRGFPGAWTAEGRIPARTLISGVELFTRARKAGPRGLSGAEALRFDWPKLVERKNMLVMNWAERARSALEKRGVEILDGQPSFTGPKELRLGDRTISGARFVLATGSVPAIPPLEGVERAVTSEQLLDQPSVPLRMVVLGGGATGLEAGFCMARAGAWVTVVQSGARILSRCDEEIVESLMGLGREAGMEFVCDARPVRIQPDRSVEAEIGGGVRRIAADVVLLSAGRRARTDGLDLPAAGVTLRDGAVVANEFLQTSAAHIYAAGEALGESRHSAVAWHEGGVAAHNALGGPPIAVQTDRIPSAVFTIPAIGQVGLTEAEARRSEGNIAVSRSALSSNPAAGAREETEGFVKVVFEQETERILGVHVLGGRAEEMAQIAAAAMAGGLTRSQLASLPAVFPAFSGSVFDAMAGW